MLNRAHKRNIVTFVQPEPLTEQQNVINGNKHVKEPRMHKCILVRPFDINRKRAIYPTFHC